jgi:hypothetical protein
MAELVTLSHVTEAQSVTAVRAVDAKKPAKPMLRRIAPAYHICHAQACHVTPRS